MKGRIWYYALVENSKGIHLVFYATSRPRIGSECPGIAAPNRVIGYRREHAPSLRTKSERS
jgi:hypothetical protein